MQARRRETEDFSKSGCMEGKHTSTYLLPIASFKSHYIPILQPSENPHAQHPSSTHTTVEILMLSGVTLRGDHMDVALLSPKAETSYCGNPKPQNPEPFENPQRTKRTLRGFRVHITHIGNHSMRVEGP